ncbi:MAG: DUF58 domain-containing protein, partial [Mogibacterium sp.]|nr:DUF58 domain-containing protein [Mogibacterium sp.]
MLGKRIAWLLILLSLAVLYLFANGTVTLALLVSCIAAPLLSLAVIMASGRHISISFEKADDNVSPAEVTLTIRNGDIMPVTDIEADIRCMNLRTGEAENVTVTRSIRPKGKVRETLIVTPGHAGRYEIAVDSMKLYDPLRLWSREIEVSDRVYLTSMPEIFELDMSLTSSSSAMPEGDRYKDSVNGNDSGEVTGIREYVPGDPVRNIHWKLSSKLDKTLVKELGQPITDNFLIVLGNSADVSFNPEALDAIASVYTSILHSLHAEGIGFTAGWTNPETGEAV